MSGSWAGSRGGATGELPVTGISLSLSGLFMVPHHKTQMGGPPPGVLFRFPAGILGESFLLLEVLPQ